MTQTSSSAARKRCWLLDLAPCLDVVFQVLDSHNLIAPMFPDCFLFSDIVTVRMFGFPWCRKYLCGAIAKHWSLYSGCRQQHYFQFQYKVFADAFFSKVQTSRAEVHLESFSPHSQPNMLKMYFHERQAWKRELHLKSFKIGRCPQQSISCGRSSAASQVNFKKSWAPACSGWCPCSCALVTMVSKIQDVLPCNRAHGCQLWALKLAPGALGFLTPPQALSTARMIWAYIISLW